MNQSASNKQENEWFDYYDRFPYFSPHAVRKGCHPRIMEHREPCEKAIVLVHGLTDSPYFMTAIADFFFDRLGYNVYLPLLHCHGLRDPKGMEGVKLEEWKSNVAYAIDTATSKAGFVSIGGLSTGGTLSFYMAATHLKINGTLYLFSAALDLAGGFVGEIKERLLRTFMADILDGFDSKKPLIGANPYRYARMDMDGAQELSELIEETDSIISGYNPKTPFPKPVFAAHSESDITADIAGIETLEKISDPNRFKFFRILKSDGVSHASLVLKDSIFAVDASGPDDCLEKKNPKFQDMMEAIALFEKRSAASIF
jgi:pimeloyl-ACP methyl ester carboxylesterase